MEKEKCFESTVYISNANNDKVEMGTQWGLTEQESIDKVMIEFNMYSAHAEFGVEDIVAIETTELPQHYTANELD